MTDAHDKYASVRPESEKRVAALNAEHKALCEAFPEECAASSQMLAASLREVYAWADKNKGKAVSDDDA